MSARLTPTENVVIRLIGLLMFFAPNTGARWLADIHIRTNERIARSGSRDDLEPATTIETERRG